MDGKLIWSSNMTRDYIKGLSDEEKKAELVNRGYDQEMIDTDGLDMVIDKDDYMGHDDEEDFMETVAPMISRQSLGGRVIAVNKLDNQAEPLIVSAEELLKDEICPEADEMEIRDVDGCVEVRYLSEHAPILTLELYVIPDGDEQGEFIEKVLAKGLNLDLEDEEMSVSNTVDENEIEDAIDVEALKQFGKKVKNDLNEEREITECGEFAFPKEG